MKLAVIGGGPLALYCARHFHHLGAQVVLFQRSPLGGKARLFKSIAPDFNLQIKDQTKSLNHFWQEDLVPLIEEIEFNQISKAGDVLRVHKRFLNPNEKIENRSRLHDLFRVVFSVNPKDSILRQVQENPEIFKQLGDQVVDSLHLPVESFEDFDLVIEASGLGQLALPMGPSDAEALNENNLKAKAPFYYEEQIFTRLNLEGKKHLIFIGETDLTALAFKKCHEWLWQKKDHSITWITTNSHLISNLNSEAKSIIKDTLREADQKFEKDKIQFETEMRAWRDLEDYVKAKVPKPSEPENKINVYRGYEVTAVDKLLDRDEVFATIESPDFRSSTLNPQDLKTIAADAMLVMKGKSDQSQIARGLVENEPGYYRLMAKSINEGLAQIKIIEENIMTFFSRQE